MFKKKRKTKKELQMSADKKQKQTDRQTVETSHLKFLSHHSKVDVHRNRVWLLRWHQYLSNQKIEKKNYMCCAPNHHRKKEIGFNQLTLKFTPSKSDTHRSQGSRFGGSVIHALRDPLSK
jgi:hypothetical protein